MSVAIPNPSNIKGLTTLRFSCSDAIHLTDEQGRYLLIQNSVAADRRRFLTPIGGAILVTRNGVRRLMRRIPGITFERPRELRGSMPASRVITLVKLFKYGKRIERDPKREFVEELSVETDVAQETALLPTRFQRIGWYSQLVPTEHRGCEKPITLRLVRVYQARCTHKMQKILLNAATQANAPVRFVTEEEIRQGETRDNKHPIGIVSHALIDKTHSLFQYSWRSDVPQWHSKAIDGHFDHASKLPQKS